MLIGILLESEQLAPKDIKIQDRGTVLCLTHTPPFPSTLPPSPCHDNNTLQDDDEQEWYFSVVDVDAILTDQATPRSASTYWAVLKKRLIEEGFQLLTNCKQLKLKAADGKRYNTDVVNTEELLRIANCIDVVSMLVQAVSPNESCIKGAL